jgi:hypothetical protein
MEDGDWILMVLASDWVGNMGQSPEVQFTVVRDILPPRTLLSAVTPYFGLNPLHAKSSTLLTLSAVDDSLSVGDATGQGVSEIRIRIDGGTVQTYAGAFDLS